MKVFGLRDEFLRHTGLMFIGISLYNLSSLLYHFFMVRYLSPVDYGNLNSLLALFMVISVPANTVQTTVTRFVSSFLVRQSHQRIRELLRHLLFRMFFIALFTFLLFGLGSPLISSFLQITSHWLVVLIAVVLLFAMILPVPWGGLQGLQRFGFLNINLILNGVLRLALGVLFVLWGLGVLGALGAIAVSYIITTFLSLFMLGLSLPEKEESGRRADEQGSSSGDLSEVYRFFLPVGMSLLCFMVLTNVDLLLVKHFFSPLEAGYYSIGQMAGKIILFLPLPVAMVMFPKLSSLRPHDREAYQILRKSLIVVGLLCVLVSAFFFIFPRLVLQILTGKAYPECIALLKLFSINMTFFSLTYVLLFYHLSTRQRQFLYMSAIFTCVQIGSIVLFHRSLIQVLLLVGLVSLCLFGINAYLAYRPRERTQE